jgi:F-type H+-transporting ATPase subunit epsilon
VAQLKVDLVAADRKIWSGDAQRVSAPAAEGEVGILADHSPLLSVLKAGSIRIQVEAGNTVTVKVSGGFISVDSNHVTLVVDDAEVLEGADASAH